MQAFFRKTILLICGLYSGFALAQKDTTDQQLDTERLIIVKPYSPTVSDAVKVKQTPQRNKESDLFQKQQVNYDIHSVPVASTFTPEKGRASGVKRIKTPQLYDSYAALGVGNYFNVMAEFYSDLKVADNNDLLIVLTHQSTQGGIKKNHVLKDKDKFYDTQFELGYKAEEENLFWGAKAGFLHQQYNWYGIFDEVFSDETRNGISPAHTYIGASLEGDIEMKEGIFDKAAVKIRHFGDDFKSSENRFTLTPDFKFEIGEDDFINTRVTFDYLGGKFKEGLQMDHSKYSILNLGIYPSYNYDFEDLAVSIGAELFYSADMENSEGEFLVHPKVKASYRIDGEYLTIYGGVGGGVHQNSYYDFAQENPYIAPGHQIVPTHTELDFFGGAKGVLTEDLEFDLRGGYKTQKNKALFHAFSESYPEENAGYMYNNSFVTLYDDINTMYGQGSLTYNFEDDLTAGFSGAIYSYSTKYESRAWNLPGIELKLYGDYRITDKWSTGAELYYLGQRKDYITLSDQPEKINVKGYLDANLRVDFQLNDHLGFFVKGNNLLNNNNQAWYHYYAQGVQGMLGASYQF